VLKTNELWVSHWFLGVQLAPLVAHPFHDSNGLKWTQISASGVQIGWGEN
jgi:hypothetical protein